MPGYYDINSIINQRLTDLRLYLEARPLILGAVATSGGGSPGRPTGFIGTLPQTRVSYDKSELGVLATSGSPSLLDNLNHIRYRLTVLESGGGPGTFTVKEDGIVVASGISILDFSGAVTVTESPAGEANVVITASGGASALNDLTDVVVTTPASGQVLTYNGTNWINAIPSGTAHAAVTVVDTPTLDLTVTGQQLQGRVIFSGVNHNQLLNTHNLTTDIDHTAIQNIGTNTHAQLDTHVADTSIHFDQIGELSNVVVDAVVSGQVLQFQGTNWRPVTLSGAAHSPVTVVDSSSIDFTLTGQQISAVVLSSGVDHIHLQNRGTNTHAVIDSHIADTTIHFDQLSELSDVTISAVASGEILKYNGSNWVNNVESSSGHLIQYSGISLTQRSTLNFTGTVAVLDNPASLKTEVKIHTHIFNEDLTSQIIASGTSLFTTSGYIKSGTLQLYYNGLRKQPSLYTTYSGNYVNTTFGLNPSDNLIVDYLLDTEYIPPVADTLLTEASNIITTEGGNLIILD